MINYIDIAFVLFVILMCYAGYRRGILFSFLGLLRYVVGLPLCFYLSDSLTNSTYQSVVKPKAIEFINSNITNAGDLGQLQKSLNEAISSFPDFIKSSFDLSSVNINDGDIAEAILSSGLETTLILLTKGLIFLIVFVVFFAVTGLVLAIFARARHKRELIAGKSILSTTDRIMGAMFGICKSFVTILALTSVLMYIQGLSDGNDNAFITQIQTSRLVSLLDQYNPINYLIGG